MVSLIWRGEGEVGYADKSGMEDLSVPVYTQHTNVADFVYKTSFALKSTASFYRVRI